MEYKDYYKTLGVDRKAKPDEIKSAYRKLALKYHPDRNQGDKQSEEKFKGINEAYQVLSDDEKRAHYDQLGSAYSSWERGGGRGGFNWDEWSSGGPGGVRVEYSGDLGDLGDLFGGSGGFSDFFSSIFGGMGGFSEAPNVDPRVRGRQRVRPGRQQAYEHEVTISLYEAYNGSTRQVNLNGRRLDVKIPPGAKSGTKVRMRGAGPKGSRGQATDVYLVIKVSPDARFKRKGNDLYTNIQLDLYTAVLGGEVNVPTMGKNVNLKIPAGTQPGQSFRISGRGMPHLKTPNKSGNLFAKAEVILPKKLSSEEKALFEKLAKLKK
jgi:curved DNA-binding protein